MMLLTALLTPLRLFNDAALRVGRAVAIAAMALMTLAILIQVFWRYVLSSPLPWPDEAARFCMLWLAGLMAPIAYRRGGFVAIGMLAEALPARLGAVLNLALLAVSGLVLAVALPIGWAEITGFSAKFATASLYYPTLDGEWTKIPRWWMSSSLFVCAVMLACVNVELILRSLIDLLGGESGSRPGSRADVAGDF